MERVKNPRKIAAGRAGGQQSYLNAGKTEEERRLVMVQRGSLGGRPRNLNLDTINRDSVLREQFENYTKEDGYPGCISLKDLAERWPIKQKSTAGNQNKEPVTDRDLSPQKLPAEGVQKTPMTIIPENEAVRC